MQKVTQYHNFPRLIKFEFISGNFINAKKAMGWYEHYGALKLAFKMVIEVRP